jgi:beta-glucosidase
MSAPTHGDRACPHPFAFQDPDAPIEARIDDLISRLTIDEKIDCLSTNPSVERLGIRASGHVEGLHGLALGGPGNWGKEFPIPTTTFPQAIGLAATWDPELVEQVAAVEAYEARYVFQCEVYRRGGLVIRAPNADLGRDPRWGRTEECYGEDPYLNGTFASAFVRGLHGPHPRYWRAAALLKHFLANSNEDERESSSSDFDERLFHEYYAVPFRVAIVEAGSRAFMTAYNKYNGVPCATHPVLKEIAVGQWQQNGIICTDGGAFKLLVTQHRHYPSLPEAAAACVHAGITQFLDDYRDSVREALARGLLTESAIDAAIRGNFRVMIRLGLLDPPERVPYACIGQPGEPEPWASTEHKSLVRRATQRSIVLLKNEATFLPLQVEALHSVLVVGDLADRVLLDWYSGTPPYAVTPLDGIRERLQGLPVHVRAVTNNDKSDAVRLARQSDIVIVCVGNHPTGDAGWARVGRDSYGKEAVDRRSLELEDEALIKAVYAANPRTLVVLISSFPYAIEWTLQEVPAILHVTHNSQELGPALADVIFGDVNPGGRLVQSWPRSLQNLAPRLDYDIRHGHTYLYGAVEPLFPFGFGLSYTSFGYSNLRLDRVTASVGDTLTVEVDVSNTGDCTGDEVVQLYVAFPESAVVRPRCELKGFQRVTLAPQQTSAIALRIPVSGLGVWDTANRCFVVEPGPVEIRIARNCLETVLTATCRITA